MLQQQDDPNWQRILREARPAVCDVGAHGIGLRRLQLIVCQSFEYEQDWAWEIRQLQSEWWLFRSEVVESWPHVQLIDYQPIAIDAALLSSFFIRVVALSLPIAPSLNDMAGIDGDITQLAVFGDMFSECRFQWWSGSPPQWQPLVDLAAEMFEAFATATRASG
jgi:hypothetical protein